MNSTNYAKPVIIGDSVGMIATRNIPINSVIDEFPMISISGRAAALINREVPALASSILANEEVIKREYEVFTKLGELELERRLDAGDISEQDYRDIIKSKVNFNALMEAKTHLLPLGTGTLYRASEAPNLVREYSTSSKLCSLRAVQYIMEGQELTYFK